MRVLKCVGKEVDLIVKYVKEVMFYFYCMVELNVNVVVNLSINGEGDGFLDSKFNCIEVKKIFFKLCFVMRYVLFKIENYGRIFEFYNFDVRFVCILWGKDVLVIN